MKLPNKIRIEMGKYVGKRCVIFIIAVIFLNFGGLAQRDTSKKQTIDIISSYKPVLGNFAKINLTPTPLKVDSNLPKLTYTIPALNLFFTYQPVTLKPLALSMDSALPLGIRNYVKAGFGNYSTPLFQADLSFGDVSKKLLNVSGGYYSSRGKIEYQDVTLANILGAGSYFSPKNELYGSAGFDFKQYYQYGFDHSLHIYPKDSVNKAYSDVSVGFGIRNLLANGSDGFMYNPNVDLHFYSAKNNVSETDLVFVLPVEKKLSEALSLSLILNENSSSYKQTSTLVNTKINNNLLTITPSATYNTDRFNLKIGIQPTIDKDKVYILPQISGAIEIQPNLLLQAGLVGNTIKNNFRSLSMLNPYMNFPSVLLSTKETEVYGGIRTKIRHHMDVFAKIGLKHYSNMPLFINDSLSGKGFYINYEPAINDINIHGEIRYYSQEKFAISGILDMNTYSGLRTNANAWELVPVKFTSDARWNVSKKAIVKGSLLIQSGIPVYQRNIAEKKLASGIDLSTGAEYMVTNKLSAWLDLDNLLNNKYARWNNYKVYGLQVLAGIKYQFK